MESPKLRSEVFLRNDIAAILQAIAVTATIASGASPEFRRGFDMCLFAVATALHLDEDAQRMVGVVRPELTDRRTSFEEATF